MVFFFFLSSLGSHAPPTPPLGAYPPPLLSTFRGAPARRPNVRGTCRRTRASVSPSSPNADGGGPSHALAEITAAVRTFDYSRPISPPAPVPPLITLYFNFYHRCFVVNTVRVLLLLLLSSDDARACLNSLTLVTAVPVDRFSDRRYHRTTIYIFYHGVGGLPGFTEI